jgi:hypothetical protein
MKIFRVEAKNDRRWVASGALDRTFYVMADDFLNATLNADAVLQGLKEKLAAASLGHVEIDSFIIRSVSELGDVVDGVVSEQQENLEGWIDSVVKSAKKDS